MVFICVYSGDLCDYEIYLSLQCWLFETDTLGCTDFRLGGGGGVLGIYIGGVVPWHTKKGGGVLGAGTAPKKGGLRCGHNQQKGCLRHVYNPKKG